MVCFLIGRIHNDWGSRIIRPSRDLCVEDRSRQGLALRMWRVPAQNEWFPAHTQHRREHDIVTIQCHVLIQVLVQCHHDTMSISLEELFADNFVSVLWTITDNVIQILSLPVQCHVQCHGRTCLLYTSDAADEEDSVDLGGRRIIKKKKKCK
eukprot:TRINITY_DN64364_c0_g1_i1.p1 TRINITY_DN64364_c0_g1~~TRINITY_DN64364_c0_g1_i1.p1  ORF type:complete len:152 (+),score=1.91 TRINITY_DN64364_c0_g1_i1:339-794(+)